MSSVRLGEPSLKVLEELARGNSFFNSLMVFYKRNGFLTEKQFKYLSPKLGNNTNDIKIETVFTRTVDSNAVQMPNFDEKPEFSILKDFQKSLVKDTYRIMEANQSALMSWDMGAGKTYGASFLLKYYTDLGYKFCVICPKPVVQKWYDICNKFNISEESRYFITNFESVINGKATVFKEKTRGTGFKEEKVVIPELEEDGFDFQPKTIFLVDEAHKFKNYKTSISKFGMRISKFKKENKESRVLLLTGTLAESPLKLWVPGVLLGKFQSLGEYFQFLQSMGCVRTDYGWELAYPKVYKSKIHDFMRSVMTRIRFEDIPDAPNQKIEIKFIENPVILDQATKDAIEQVEARIGRYKTKADTDIVQMLRERQLRELEKLGEIAREISDSNKYVVFLNYSQSIDLLYHYLTRKGKRVKVFDGRNINEREANRIAFQNQELDALICNIQAANEGIDLHDTSVGHKYPRVALFSPCYNAQMTAQALGRVHRIGGGFVYQRFMIVENTIEEEVWRKIADKLDNLDKLNEGESVLLKELKRIEDQDN